MNTNDGRMSWPLEVGIPLLGEQSNSGIVSIRPGINTLVGPNGSGKTRALRRIKDVLRTVTHVSVHGRLTHFLAAGRSSPLEPFRAAVNTPGSIQQNDAAVGHIDYQNRWWEYESITGALLALNERADLRLKIEARLQQLLDRSVQLSWSHTGLNIKLSSMSGGEPYAANHEASGILQLVALLAAIHNDQIWALLIDEPEISLHPQHQAFLLEEMESVAGDPSKRDKKLIVIGTHSASLLPLRRLGDLPSIAFLGSPRQAPTQIASDDDILKRKKLGAMIARLTTTHRAAMFAEHVLLVEGPSDEIIASQLARCLDLRLHARNAQILPITGKGEFNETTKLFRLMNKRVTVLADLDALADENTLVCQFAQLPDAAAIANKLARANLADLDRELRGALAKFMTDHQAAVDAAAEDYPDWSSRDSSPLSKRRVTLARILTDPDRFGGAVAGEAQSLRTRYTVLLDALAKLGCFFLRRGAIENYYRVAKSNESKPDLAAQEAAEFEARGVDALRYDYEDVIAAIAHVAPSQRVDENLLLRPKLSAVLAATFQGMKADDSDERLNSLARNTIGMDATIFKLLNRSSADDLRIAVELASPLFKSDNVPFVVGRDENLNTVIPNKLPSTGQT